MSQHDYDIADQAGATFLADLNNALAAIVGLNSGATAPATTFAYQLWADTTTGKLKIRNAADSAWIEIGSLSSTGLGLLSKAGDTMTGALTLSGAPTSALHAATKTYVDTGDAANLPKAGGTMTGALTLSGAPSSGLHATTKTYTDTADALRVAKTGDTMTGALILNGAPTNALQAATKAYVDGASDQDLVADGFQRLSSGLLIQWGQHTISGYSRLSGAVSAVTFPTAFTAFAHVLVEKNTTSPSRLPQTIWAERGTSKTGFSVIVAGDPDGVGTADMVVSWLAIGY